jgi:hypothetical protein
MVIGGSYEVAVKMMGDMNFLTALLNFAKEQINDETVELLQVRGPALGWPWGCAGRRVAVGPAPPACAWPSHRGAPAPRTRSPTLRRRTSTTRAPARRPATSQVGPAAGAQPEAACLLHPAGSEAAGAPSSLDDAPPSRPPSPRSVQLGGRHVQVPRGGQGGGAQDRGVAGGRGGAQGKRWGAGDGQAPIGLQQGCWAACIFPQASSQLSVSC